MALFTTLKSQARKFLSSERGRRSSSQVLDKAERLATNRFGAGKAGQVRKVRGAVDRSLGINRPGEDPRAR